MTDIPEPLTPPDCDLRDFAFMPLDVMRLRDSDLAIQATAEEFRAAVMLWCAAWHQIPAASLPDDDKVLSALAGFGRVVDAWKAVRNGALRGWVACQDGRLYHPVVAEKARDAWTAKLKQRFKTECGRIKKYCQRHELPYDEPDFDEWVSAGCPVGQPLNVPKTNGECPEDKKQMSRGQGGNVSGTGKGQKKGGTQAHDDGAGSRAPEQGVKSKNPAVPKTNGKCPEDNHDLSQGQPPHVPGENASKGQGEGQGEVNTIPTNDDVGDLKQVGPVDNSESSSSMSVQEMADLLTAWEYNRGYGGKTRFDAGQPQFALWRAKGLRTEPQLRSAYDDAVAQRERDSDHTAVNAGFLDAFVAKVLAPPRVVTLPLQAMTAIQLDDECKRLGIGCARPGEETPHLIARIQAAREQRRRI